MIHDINVVRMCVAAYLEHIRQLDESRRALEENMERLESSLSLGAIRYTDAPAGGSGDRLGDGVARLLELREQWGSVVLDASKEYGEAMAYCFQTVPRRFCWMHWVEGASWTALAARTSYHPKSCMRIAREGLMDIYNWMPEEWRRALPSAQPWE